MFVHKGNEHPIYVEFFLHHGPYQRRVGIFADTMLAVIIGFNVKGHRATSPLSSQGSGSFPKDAGSFKTKRSKALQGFRLRGFSLDFILTRSTALSKTVFQPPTAKLYIISKVVVSILHKEKWSSRKI